MPWEGLLNQLHARCSLSKQQQQTKSTKKKKKKRCSLQKKCLQRRKIRVSVRKCYITEGHDQTHTLWPNENMKSFRLSEFGKRTEVISCNDLSYTLASGPLTPSMYTDTLSSCWWLIGHLIAHCISTSADNNTPLFPISELSRLVCH